MKRQRTWLMSENYSCFFSKMDIPMRLRIKKYRTSKASVWALYVYLQNKLFFVHRTFQHGDYSFKSLLTPQQFCGRAPSTTKILKGVFAGNGDSIIAAVSSRMKEKIFTVVARICLEIAVARSGLIFNNSVSETIFSFLSIKKRTDRLGI